MCNTSWFQQTVEWKERGGFDLGAYHRRRLSWIIVKVQIFKSSKVEITVSDLCGH